MPAEYMRNTNTLWVRLNSGQGEGFDKQIWTPQLKILKQVF